jgi:hypothetical protein
MTGGSAQVADERAHVESWRWTHAPCAHWGARVALVEDVHAASLHGFPTRSVSAVTSTVAP